MLFTIFTYAFQFFLKLIIISVNILAGLLVIYVFINVFYFPTKHKLWGNEICFI